MSSGQARARRTAAACLALGGLLGLTTSTVQALDGGFEDTLLGAPLEECGAAAITIGYDVEYAADLGGYAVTGVRLSDVPASCAEVAVRVALTDPSGAVLADVRAEGTGSARSALLGVPVAATQVDSVSLVLGDLPTR
ncbi:hypothetical protein ACGIF2_06990 [Cellulomonas sp. P22]|uniref:hypothetical protein n=1 Tax=Cellulomonas sp. P22 TaxID=3373189 RepID=UPI0037ADA6EA